MSTGKPWTFRAPVGCCPSHRHTFWVMSTEGGVRFQKLTVVVWAREQLALPPGKGMPNWPGGLDAEIARFGSMRLVPFDRLLWAMCGPGMLADAELKLEGRHA
jgi:hypothetical protein